MKEFVKEIKQLLDKAREKVYSTTSYTMIECYWEMGRRIVEKEQQGQDRAAYGKEILQNLSDGLGQGFSTRTLRDIRKCYLTFPQWEDLAHACAKLEWSHIRAVTRVSDPKARLYYIREASQQNWGVRQLERNINTLYYQRLLSSQNPQPVEDEIQEDTKDLQYDNHDFIRNPTVLEFLNIPTNYSYTEKQLEQSLIDNLQQFLLELGKGFAFVARQKYIRTETSDFFIDLVFYNYILKCFIIIELKTDKITHQDIGQLDMYVRMFDDLERKEGGQPDHRDTALHGNGSYDSKVLRAERKQTALCQQIPPLSSDRGRTCCTNCIIRRICTQYPAVNPGAKEANISAIPAYMHPKTA